MFLRTYVVTSFYKSMIIMIKVHMNIQLRASPIAYVSPILIIQLDSKFPSAGRR